MAALHAADSASPEFVDVFVSGQDGYPNYRIPSLVVTTKGTLLALCEGRTKNDDHAANDLVLKRSSDGGRTWSAPERILAGPKHEAVTGKLPNVLALPGGMLALLTAHTKRGCFLHLSRDGSGREWDEAQLITKVTGGNTSMVSLDASTLLVFTPANGRIHCWRVTLPSR